MRKANKTKKNFDCYLFDRHQSSLRYYCFAAKNKMKKSNFCLWILFFTSFGNMQFSVNIIISMLTIVLYFVQCSQTHFVSTSTFAIQFPTFNIVVDSFIYYYYKFVLPFSPRCSSFSFVSSFDLISIGKNRFVPPFFQLLVVCFAFSFVSVSSFLFFIKKIKPVNARSSIFLLNDSIY